MLFKLSLEQCVKIKGFKKVSFNVLYFLITFTLSGILVEASTVNTNISNETVSRTADDLPPSYDSICQNRDDDGTKLPKTSQTAPKVKIFDEKKIPPPSYESLVSTENTDDFLNPKQNNIQFKSEKKYTPIKAQRSFLNVFSKNRSLLPTTQKHAIKEDSNIVFVVSLSILGVILIVGSFIIVICGNIRYIFILAPIIILMLFFWVNVYRDYMKK